VIRCGDTGMGGLGAHAHNDQLSFELSAGDQPLVVDPGSYVYTGNAAARSLFRSTGFHSTLAVDGLEQNEIRSDRPFELRDRTRAEANAWSADEDRVIFVGRHHGYEALSSPAVHVRSLTLERRLRQLVIEDTVESAGSHALEWTFPLAPCDVRLNPGVALATFDNGTLAIETEDAELRVDEGWYSPRYGVRVSTRFVRAFRRSSAPVDVARFTVRVL
jgi:uncharacterized heparinase superfamily protein